MMYIVYIRDHLDQIKNMQAMKHKIGFASSRGLQQVLSDDIDVITLKPATVMLSQKKF